VIEHVDRGLQGFSFHKSRRRGCNERRDNHRSRAMNSGKDTLAQRVYLAVAMFGLGLAGL
jgi:hypothetical protein